jgi:hypothetical protein
MWNNNKTFKVKIVKVKLPSYWYKDMIGRIVEVRKYDDENYQNVELSLYLIAKEDVVLITKPTFLNKIFTRIKNIFK